MKGKAYLLTATLLLLIALNEYEPYLYPQPMQEELNKDEVDGLMLYSLEVFKDSTFEFVRADNFNGYAKYEVTGSGDLQALKDQLTQHLKAQGYDGDILILLVNPNNKDEVIKWL